MILCNKFNFMRRFKITKLLLISLFALLFPLLAFAQGNYGLDDTAKEAGLYREETLPQITGNVIGTILSLISVIFFVLMLYGGFLWMTARGNETQETKAKDTIIAAVIGIIIVLGSYAITQFVFKSIGTGNSTAEEKTDTTVKTCDVYKTEFGLGCYSLTEKCATDLGDVKKAWDKFKVGVLKTPGDGVNYIEGICPGGNNIVCCVPQN
jgi:hypothetical protein